MPNSTPNKSEGRSDMHLSSLANSGTTQRCYSIILMCQCACRGNCKLDACQGTFSHVAKAGSQASLQTYESLQAPGFQTMICLQVNWQGLQGMQTYDMFMSTWLAKISYVPKPCKVIPFVFVGIGPLVCVQIGIHMIPFGWSLGGQQQCCYWKISITLHRHLYFHLLVMFPSPQ